MSTVGVWELNLRTYEIKASADCKAHFGRDPNHDFGYADLFGMDLDIECPIFESFRTGKEPRWVEIKAQIERVPGGSAPRLVGVSMDVTQRRLDHVEVQHTEMLLQAVLETAPGLISAKDKDKEGRMLIANPPALALIGKPWAAVRGRTDAELLDDAAQGEAIMRNDRRVMDSGQAEVLEETVGSVDGCPRVWLSTKAPLRDAAGRPRARLTRALFFIWRCRMAARIESAPERGLCSDYVGLRATAVQCVACIRIFAMGSSRGRRQP